MLACHTLNVQHSIALHSQAYILSMKPIALDFGQNFYHTHPLFLPQTPENKQNAPEMPSCLLTGQSQVARSSGDSPL